MPRLLDKAYGLKAAISGEGAASRFSNSIIENNDVAGQEINSKNNHPKEKPVLPQDTLGKYENSRDERRFYESYYQNSNTLIDNQMYDIPVALKEKGSPLFAGRAAGGKPEPYLIEETDAGQESAGGLIMKAFGSNKYNIDEIYLNNRSSGNDKTRKPALYEENAFTDMLFCLSGNPS
jgi:hypothetical protein